MKHIHYLPVIAAVLILCCGYYQVLNYFNDSPDLWFQRSGAMATVILLIAEIFIPYYNRVAKHRLYSKLLPEWISKGVFKEIYNENLGKIKEHLAKDNSPEAIISYAIHFSKIETLKQIEDFERKRSEVTALTRVSSLKVVVGFLIVVSTLVWGYGDLIYLELNTKYLFEIDCE